ncbi:MAG: hypothetical protein BWY88_01336 [Synergistetes bacterium ADurb.Bin520]|nr:MAG: hypothetical protein BWY88_01336 [Synergistetes bacterium ADurb.Bin520]
MTTVSARVFLKRSKRTVAPQSGAPSWVVASGGVF